MSLTFENQYAFIPELGNYGLSLFGTYCEKAIIFILFILILLVILIVAISVLYSALVTIGKALNCPIFELSSSLSYSRINFEKPIIKDILSDLIKAIKINNSNATKIFKKIVYNENDTRFLPILINGGGSAVSPRLLKVIPSDPVFEFFHIMPEETGLKYFKTHPQGQIVPDPVFKDVIISNSIMRCFTRFLYDQIISSDSNVLSVLLNESDSNAQNLALFTEKFSEPEKILWKRLIAEYEKLVKEIKKAPEGFNTVFIHEILSKICFMIMYFNRLNWPLFYSAKEYMQEYSSFDCFCSNVKEMELLRDISSFLGCLVHVYQKHIDGQTYIKTTLGDNNTSRPTFEVLYDKDSRIYKLCRVKYDDHFSNNFK